MGPRFVKPQITARNWEEFQYMPIINWCPFLIASTRHKERGIRSNLAARIIGGFFRLRINQIWRRMTPNAMGKKEFPHQLPASPLTGSVYWIMARTQKLWFVFLIPCWCVMWFPAPGLCMCNVWASINLSPASPPPYVTCMHSALKIGARGTFYARPMLFYTWLF